MAPSDDPARSAAPATGKPRLLFLSHILPYPPDRGVAIRTYHLLRILSGAFDVTLLCFYRWKDGRMHADLEGNAKGLTDEVRCLEAYPIPQERSRLRFLWDHARSVALRRPYTHFLYDSREYEAALARQLSETSFDLVHADTLDLSRHFSRLGAGLPLVCNHHNLDSQGLRRRADYEPSRWRGAYLRHQADLLDREIRRWCEDVALNLVVSENDRAQFRDLAPGARISVAPNGVDTRAFRPRNGRGEGVVFVGGTTWRPNEDALQYFCGQILPRLRRNGAEVPVRWVGRSSVQEQRHYAAEHGVDLTGYVEDIRPFVHEAGCYVVPLRIGGGTRLKILDAWAMGKAVVSTSVGCEGLDARDGENILVRDDPEEFARTVRRVLDDDELREELGREARRTVEEKYSWDVIGEKVIGEYEELL